MNLKRLAVAAGAGDPDSAPALRVDVIKAAEQLVAAIDAKGLTESEYLVDIEKATDEVYRRTKKYQRACKQRAQS